MTEAPIDAGDPTQGALSFEERRRISIRLGAGLAGVGFLALGTLLLRLAPDQWQIGELCRGVAAAIVYADLRGFTNFADETAPEEVIRRLNGIFDCLGEPVRAAGGEILKFMGDGLLAIFPIASEDGAGEVGQRALSCAREFRARFSERAFRIERLPGLDFWFTLGDPIQAGPHQPNGS